MEGDRDSDTHLAEIHTLGDSGIKVSHPDIVNDLCEEIRLLSLPENVEEDENESHLDIAEASPRDGVHNLDVTGSEDEDTIHGSCASNDHTILKGNDRDHDTERRSVSEENTSNTDTNESGVDLDYMCNGIQEFNSQSETETMERDEDSTRRHQFPLRPDAEDCAFYLKTGTCKFGLNCKFNHPIRYLNNVAIEQLMDREDLSDRQVQVDCKYFSRTGGCKYGKACRYNHARGRFFSPTATEFNFLGLPMRPGERECPYYMRTGSCKYGTFCRFNHPDPTTVGGCDATSAVSIPFHIPVQPPLRTWSSAQPANATSSFVPMMFPQMPSPTPEFNGFPGSVYASKKHMQHPVYAMNGGIESVIYPYQHNGRGEFPERPGQPECSYFMKTGDCKYRSACRYHHPWNRVSNSSPCILSEKGLPLRPDQNTCTYYERYGICKFGPACRFNHPVASGPGLPV